MDKHIRKIFSVFALVMLVLLIYAISNGFWSNLNWMMLTGSAVCCVLVFMTFVYIFNFSYALACILNGTLLAVWFGNGPAILLGGAMALYGLRLLLFTWFRTRSASYAPKVKNVQQADAYMPTPIKAALWVQCSLLYCFHQFATFIAAQAGWLSPSVLAGTALILAGTYIEGAADYQKQRAKAIASDQFVSSGLFSRWRHPNYAGEILVQLGLIVAGVGTLLSSPLSSPWINYVAVTVAPLYIILLMLSECIRGDRHMQTRYGTSDAFRAYAARSGSVFPRF
jgi:steroid 5-alpha reductase family enzyme